VGEEPNCAWETITPWGFRRESERLTVCAEQHIADGGLSPSGAQMSSAGSERAGNASRAREKEKPKWARKRKPETAKADLKPLLAILRRAGCPLRSGIRRA